MRTGPDPDRARVWLAAVLAGAAVLRLLALAKPLYIDEIVSVTVAVQPLDRMAAVMRQIDASPALAPLLLHVWLLLHDADWWARLLMACAGVATVALVYVIASRQFSRATGRWAALVAALLPPLVHYSQYVRNYSLFTLLAAAYILLALEWFDGRRAGRPAGADAVEDAGRETVAHVARRAALVAGTATAMLYTHYLAPLVFAAPCAFALWHLRQDRRRVLAWMAAHVIAIVLFLPGVPLLLHNVAADRVRNESRHQPPATAVLVPNLVAELSVGQRALGFSDPAVRRATLAGAAVVFPVLFVSGLIAGWRLNRKATVLVALTAVLPLAIYIGAGRRLVAVRFFLPCLIGYAVLIGAGLASWRSAWRTAGAVALALLCGVPLWHFYTRFEWSYDHRAVARAMLDGAAPGDAVLVVHPYEGLYYTRYLGGAMPVKGLVFTALEDQPGYVIKPPPLVAASARPRVEDAAARYARVWVVGQSTKSFASDAVQQAFLLRWMDERYHLVRTLDGITGGDPTVRLYATQDATSAAHAP